ncbi:MAG: FAD-binding oxidoreductase, partial [Thermoplasmata archaeon]
ELVNLLNEAKNESNHLNEVDVSSEIYKDLSHMVGKERVSESNLDRLLYSHDLAPLPKEMSLAFKTIPDIVVKPRDAIDVSRIMKYAVENDIPVIPRGGATWAFGGAVPAFGGIVLDIGSMQEILDVNKENLFVTVEPGINWKKLYDTLLSKDLLIGAYPSSAPGASVGGWVNTGGVGVGSYKYGGIDQLIRSLEVVLSDGTIITTGCKNVLNNSSGYNLTDLFIGSEGTLGIITKVTLKVFPAPEEIRPTSFVFRDLEEAGEAIHALTRTNITPYHIAFLDGAHYDLLRELDKDSPKIGAMVNITFSGDTRIIDIQDKTTEKIMAEYGGKKTTKEFADHEWDERFFESKARRLGPGLIVGESFCPLSKIVDMSKRSQGVLKKLKMKGAVVGTVADPNTALFMTYAISNEHKLIKNMASMALVKKLADEAFKVGGRPGGFGLLFSGNLKKIHGKGVFVMDDIKSALDPHYIMNPGKLIESTTRFGIPIPGFAMAAGMNILAFMKRMMPADKIGMKNHGTKKKNE